MARPIRVLIVDDSEADAALILYELKRGGFKVVSRRADDCGSMTEALAQFSWDIILCDHAMPHFDSFAALRVLQNSGRDLPLIVVSGEMTEEAAAAAMKVGAHDYISKSNLSRLCATVERELERASQRNLEMIHRETLQTFTREMLKAQEAERKRISRDLHDGALQQLCLLSLELDQELSRRRDRRLVRIKRELDATVDALRRFCQELRPELLDQLGLEAALRWMAEQGDGRGGLSTEVKVIGKEVRPSLEVEVALFRIAQEAMTNIRRHAEATEVRIVLEQGSKGIRLAISDNGLGFVVPDDLSSFSRTGQLGLFGMFERAKLAGLALMVESKLGAGTTVTAETPAANAGAG